MNYIGIDIGGTKCVAILGEESGGTWKIKEKIMFNTAGKTPANVLTKFDSFIKKITSEYKIEGIGISCGGPLDSKNGVILSPPNLPGWDEVRITEHFQSQWGIKTFLQNDANACALAEWKYGAGKDCKDMVFLTFGTGLGAGIIANGRLICGASNMAGEVGHIRLRKTGPVGYGKHGSFEGFCSGGGIAQLGVAAINAELKNGRSPKLLSVVNGDTKQITAKLIGNLADGGDDLCLRIYEKCGTMLGEGLSIIIDLLNPEAIVLGSIYMRSEHLLRAAAMRVIEKEALSYSRKACELRPAELGERLGDIAALSVATGEFKGVYNDGKTY